MGRKWREGREGEGKERKNVGKGTGRWAVLSWILDTPCTATNMHTLSVKNAIKPLKQLTKIGDTIIIQELKLRIIISNKEQERTKYE